MSRTATVPVLTYHSMKISGTGYADNDHVAFAADLERIHALGLRIVPAWEVACACVEGRLESLRGSVALTMDDGPDFDAFDLPHPIWGPQRGMLGILRDFRAHHGESAQPDLHATSFVIVSPAARAELDRHEMIGCGWWNDTWWRAAESTGLMAIESHSWDHNQFSLERTVASAPRGTFVLSTPEEAHAEITQATRYLREQRGRQGEVLFAYPYGPACDFLADAWFPDGSLGHGVYAAFTTEARPVTAGMSRWRLPRFVCGWHWQSADGLEDLLRDCLEAPVRGRPRNG